MSESRKIPTTSRYNFWLNQPGTLRDSVGCLIQRTARIFESILSRFNAKAQCREGAEKK